MKLRILDNTLRLRLDRHEVDQLGAGTGLTAETRFPGGEVFCYRIEAAGADLTATKDQDGIRLCLPEQQLASWAADETQVGIYASLPLTEGCLALTIEKDFECLDPREGENQINRFSNPKAAD